MAVSVHGLPAALVAAIEDALHDVADASNVAVVGIDLSNGPELLRLEPASWDHAIGAARDAFFAMQAASALLVEQGGGCLLVLVPVHSLRTSRGCGVEAVVGSFLTTAAQVAAVELGSQGVRVNVLAVGPLEGEVDARTAESVPIGRLARPSDVGAACAMLASPQAGFVSGAVVPVDGGYAVTKAVGGSPFADAGSASR
jgi:NAD(P)-dependent dehydrogenase (short-subunit alcohol dehydrogenase family)